MINKSLLSILLTLTLTCSYFVTVNADQTSLNTIFGKSYIETAIETSKELNSNSNTYIISDIDDYPDALSGTGLASRYNAPILFVSKEDNTKLFDYLKSVNSNKDTKFFVLGGTGAVSQSIEDTLKSISNSVLRFSGSDRFETCQLINNYLNAKQGTPVIIAEGYSYADALSISAIGGQLQYPMILVNKDSIPNKIVEQLQSIKPSTVYIAGGAGVVSDSVEQQIKNLTSAQIIRFSGKDRYDTSTKISDYFKNQLKGKIYTTGEDFHDALVSIPLAGKNHYSIQLTYDSNQLSNVKSNDFIIGTLQTNNVPRLFWGLTDPDLIKYKITDEIKNSVNEVKNDLKDTWDDSVQKIKSIFK